MAGHGIFGVGAASFADTVGIGVSIASQNATDGVASAISNGAGVVGGDDGKPSTKNGQGGGTGKNASTDCMTAIEHSASIGRDLGASIGTGPQSCPPDYGGWQEA